MDTIHTFIQPFIFSDQKVAEVKQEEDLNLKSIETALSHFLKFLKIEFKSALFFLPRSSSEFIRQHLAVSSDQQRDGKEQCNVLTTPVTQVSSKTLHFESILRSMKE